MDALPIQSDSECPGTEAVQAEVRELTTLDQRRAVAADAKVFVSDRGDSIAIAITRDGQTTVRVYEDAARDCARRSHFVSVLVVVSLMPPDLGTPQPEPGPKPEPPAPATPTRASRVEGEATPPKRVRIELGARAEAAARISDTPAITSWGGALNVAIGTGDLRFTLATSYMPRSELRFTGAAAGRAELERLEGGLGVRIVLGHVPIDTSLDLGALAMRAQVTGQSSHAPAQDTAFNLGARVGISLCWCEQRSISPFIGAYANLFPSPPALSQLPQGRVGHLPYVWFGLGAGLSLAL